MKKYLLTALVLLSAIAANAQAQPSSYSLFVDEDFWQRFGKATDRNYTMGFGIKVSNASLSTSRLGDLVAGVKDSVGQFLRGHWMRERDALPVGFDKVSRYFPVAQQNSLVNQTGYLVFIGTGFTPVNLNTPDIQYDDRPYSNLVSLTYGIGRLYYPVDKKPRFYQTEVTLGVLGTGVGPQVQTWIHRMMNNHDTTNPHTPKGWPNQISNGGEPTFMVLNRSKMLLLSVDWRFKNTTKAADSKHPFRMLEVTLGRESFVGYYTGVGMSMGARVGVLDFRNWVSNIFPLQAGSQATNSRADLGDIRTAFGTNRKFELYLSSEIKPMLTIYNAMLQGQFRTSPYTIPGNKINQFGYNWNNAIGVNLRFGPKLNVNAIHNFYAYKSPEFRRDNYVGQSHVWGGFYITGSWFPSR